MRGRDCRFAAETSQAKGASEDDVICVEETADLRPKPVKRKAVPILLTSFFERAPKAQINQRHQMNYHHQIQLNLMLVVFSVFGLIPSSKKIKKGGG
jgi:hypothetical protein